jgi:hypothetical protein
MPVALQAGVWGLAAASALVIGAWIGCLTSVPPRLVAAIMAFGSGVLISALSFNLMSEAYKTGGFTGTALGFVAGAVLCTGRTSCSLTAAGGTGSDQEASGRTSATHAEARVAWRSRSGP